MRAPAFAAVSRGVSQGTRNLRVTVWVYVFSLFAALPVALCAGALVHGYFGRSLEAGVIASGIDLGLAVEFVLERSIGLGLLPAVILGALLSWVLLSALVNGTLLSAVKDDVPPMMGDLFLGAGRVFGRLLRLFFLGVPFVAVPVGLLAWGVFKLADAISQNWYSAGGVFLLRLAAVAILLLVALWFKGVYDLMKVTAVVKGERRARHAFVDGLRLGLRHPVQTLLVHLPFAMIAVASTVAFSLLDASWTRSSWVMVAIGVAFQQTIALVRAWAQVSLAAAEVAFVRGIGRPR